MGSERTCDPTSSEGINPCSYVGVECSVWSLDIRYVATWLASPTRMDHSAVVAKLQNEIILLRAALEEEREGRVKAIEDATAEVIQLAVEESERLGRGHVGRV